MKKENIFQFQEADDSIGFLLWRVHNAWQRELRRQLKKFNLTHTQFVILACAHWLNQQDEEVSQVKIARLAKTDTMLTSNVLRALEKKRLIRRKEHSKDSRAKKILLTKAGIKRLKKAVNKVENFDREFFSHLTNSRQFKTELSKLLKALATEQLDQDPD